MYLYSGFETQVNPDRNKSLERKVLILKEQMDQADAIIIGAGSGLSTAAGYVYTGERMEKYFGDFVRKYGFHDMYSGGFYPYQTMEEYWGFWCRYIWINRYAPVPGNLYEKILSLLKGKDYFVLTTNVDHCFQRAGFDKHRLFYTQGDYGLFQSAKPSGKSARKAYDNYEIIRQMVLSEGYEIDENNELLIPEGKEIRMEIPSSLIPYCPDDGRLMTTNLRGDDTFVEDGGWHRAEQRYYDFLIRHKGLHVLYLEMGVGMNTPVIIKFPFQHFVSEDPKAFYACLSYGQASTGKSIARRSVCIDEGIEPVVNGLLEYERNSR